VATAGINGNILYMILNTLQIVQPLDNVTPHATSFDQSSSKICLRQTSLTDALSWAHYQNENDHIYYVNDKQHTLSLYMSGGYDTHRTDVSSSYGAPGKFCLMPKDSESHWQLGQTQQFMHLYLMMIILNSSR